MNEGVKSRRTDISSDVRIRRKGTRNSSYIYIVESIQPTRIIRITLANQESDVANGLSIVANVSYRYCECIE